MCLEHPPQIGVSLCGGIERLHHVGWGAWYDIWNADVFVDNTVEVLYWLQAQLRGVGEVLLPVWWEQVAVLLCCVIKVQDRVMLVDRVYEVEDSTHLGGVAQGASAVQHYGLWVDVTVVGLNANRTVHTLCEKSPVQC